MEKDEFVSRIDDYVRKFGGASYFVQKIINSFDCPFAIVNADSLEIEITNSTNFSSGIKCCEFFKCEESMFAGENCLIDRVVKSKKSVIIESSSSNLSLEMHAHPIMNSEGDVVSVIIYGLDVSLLQDLNESNEKYRVLFEQAADSITISDIETGKFLDFNKSAYEKLGYTKGEFGKLGIPDIEERESFKDFKEHAKIVMKNGRDNFESRHRKKNGEVMDVSVSIKIIEIGGKKYQQSIWKDITQGKEVERRLKQSEDRFYNILQNSQALVYRYDFGKDSFDYVSESVFTILGYSLGEFMKMKRGEYNEMIHPDDIGAVEDLGDKNEEESVSVVEYRFRKKDGDYVWVSVNRVFFRDDKGNLLYSIEDLKDISLEKLAEEERVRLEDRIVHMKNRYQESKERTSLTGREKLVLWGLCRYPLLNDEELAKKLDLKRSTLTAIKNRLKGKGWFSLNYIPNFRKLGCQFFSIFDVGFKGGKSKGVEVIKNELGVVLSNYQDDKFFGVFVSNKYVDFKRFLNDVVGSDILKNGFNEDSFFMVWIMSSCMMFLSCLILCSFWAGMRSLLCINLKMER